MYQKSGNIQGMLPIFHFCCLVDIKCFSTRIVPYYAMGHRYLVLISFCTSWYKSNHKKTLNECEFQEINK